MKRNRKSGIPYWAYWGQRSQQPARRQVPDRKVHFEPLEPRLLLSADTLFPGIVDSMDQGLDAFGKKVQDFVVNESLLDTSVPTHTTDL